MKRLALLMFVIVIAASLSRLAVHVPAAGPPSNFSLSDPPKPLPDIAIGDGDGAARTLSDFRGKFVLLNIWATWCVPCRKEMPTLDRLQGLLGGPDFEVVALSIDRAGAPAVRKYFTEIGIQHLAMRFDAAAEAPFKLAAVGLPTTLLIDREGREIGRLIGPAEWDSPEMIDFLKATIAQKDSRPSPTPTPNQEN